ncbi:hypothetical protein [Staphylococcus casei]|uniref:Uncharacterized protein n=1 Tax=Staphylococcus casei TaxID=201828 RepID=A0ABZ2W9W5_9STAP|nr:hypothetical protein BU056_09610 [Staphylococcus succinus]
MTQSINEIIQLQLYDLYDDTKFKLSELNQNKSLDINGPDSKLIKRGLDISYLQGQKKAIDAINTILETYPATQDFINYYNQYAKNYLQEFETSSTQFQNMVHPQDEFELFLANHYQLMGQKSIINTINTLVNN